MAAAANDASRAPKKRKPKRKRVGGLVEFTEEDARRVAARFLFDFGRVKRPTQLFMEPECPAVQHYEDARMRLREFTDLTRVGFHLYPDWLDADTAAQVLRFCDGGTFEWEPRLGTAERPIPNTKRKNFGVTMTRGYKPRKDKFGLPDPLDQLGKRVLDFCKQESASWTSSCTNLSCTPPFVQAYVQRYTPGQTLGFHFDNRGEYAELICGVTLCGEGRFLLSPTSGSQGITDQQLNEQANVAVIKLPPLSLYVMTGMSRYDLRHGAAQDGDQERVSVTFRSLAPDKNWIKDNTARVKAAFN